MSVLPPRGAATSLLEHECANGSVAPAAVGRAIPVEQCTFAVVHADSGSRRKQLLLVASPAESEEGAVARWPPVATVAAVMLVGVVALAVLRCRVDVGGTDAVALLVVHLTRAHVEGIRGFEGYLVRPLELIL